MNKQFKVENGYDAENKPCLTIRDTITTEIYSMDNTLEANSLCTKMNELAEENKELRHQLDTLDGLMVTDQPVLEEDADKYDMWRLGSE